MPAVSVRLLSSRAAISASLRAASWAACCCFSAWRRFLVSSPASAPATLAASRSHSSRPATASFSRWPISRRSDSQRARTCSISLRLVISPPYSFFSMSWHCLVSTARSRSRAADAFSRPASFSRSAASPCMSRRISCHSRRTSSTSIFPLRAATTRFCCSSSCSSMSMRSWSFIVFPPPADDRKDRPRSLSHQKRKISRVLSSIFTVMSQPSAAAHAVRWAVIASKTGRSVAK